MELPVEAEHHRGDLLDLQGGVEVLRLGDGGPEVRTATTAAVAGEGKTFPRKRRIRESRRPAVLRGVSADPCSLPLVLRWSVRDPVPGEPEAALEDILDGHYHPKVAPRKE